MAEEPKERKAFEAHMRVGGYSNHDKHPDGSYVSSAMELWWQGWKARAQLPNQGGEAVATDAFVPGSLADLLFQLGEKGIGVSGGTHGDHWKVSPLYTHPADQVSDGVTVSRERLEHWADKLEDSESNGYGWEDALAAELRALLNGGRS